VNALPQMARPVDIARKLVQLVLVAITSMRNAPQHAAREARFEIDVIRKLERPGEAGAAVGRTYKRSTEADEFAFECSFESTRTRRKERFGVHAAIGESCTTIGIIERVI
jgi:hypothetical protein